MDDGGYTRPELWLSEGWTTIREQGWRAPLYRQTDPEARSGWRIFTLHGWQPLDSDDLSETPVCHISLFEAAAYAQWAARRAPGPPSRPSSNGNTQLSTNPGDPSFPASSERVGFNLLESDHLHPTRAPSLPGLRQIFGDVWEWTSSAYTGYPGYPTRFPEPWRVQRQVHVLADGPPRRLVRHTGHPHPGHLSKLFLPRHPLAVLRPAARPRRRTIRPRAQNTIGATHTA